MPRPHAVGPCGPGVRRVANVRVRRLEDRLLEAAEPMRESFRPLPLKVQRVCAKCKMQA